MSSEVAALARVHDRVLATPNDKLPQILDKLLPGLLPLANKDALRPQVLVIISNLVRRIKVLRTPLPCSVLLRKLVVPDMMSFGCNITLTLLDIALEFESPDRGLECTNAILTSLACFFPPVADGQRRSKVFTLQQNSLLNYAIDMLNFLPSAVNTTCLEMLCQPLPVFEWISNCTSEYAITSIYPSNHLELLWDFMLDLSLAQAPLIKDSVGSVQPGLSQQRVERLCHRARQCDDDSQETSNAWFLPQLKTVKVKLLSLLSPNWMHPAYIGAISAACMSDSQNSDQVVQEACFKLNGLKAAIQNYRKLRIESIGSMEEIDILEEVVCGLLRLCLTGGEHGVNGNSRESEELGLSRMTIREEVRVSLLTWIKNEAFAVLSCPSVASLLMQLVRQTFMPSNTRDGISLINTKSSSCGIMLQSIIMSTVNVVSKHLHSFIGTNKDSPSSLSTTSFKPLLQSVYTALSPFADNGGNASGKHESKLYIEHDSLKKEALVLLDRLSRFMPCALVNLEGGSGLHFATLLFKLLDIDAQSGSDATAALFSALGGIRLAYAKHLSTLLSNQSQRVQREHQLASLLQIARSSHHPKKRVLVLHWAKIFFGYSHPLVLESMMILAGDRVESVRSEAFEEFRLLRKLLPGMMRFKQKFSEDNTLSESPVNSSMITNLENVFSSLLRVEILYPSPSGEEKSSSAAGASQQEILSQHALIREEVFATASCILEEFLREVQRFAVSKCVQHRFSYGDNDWLSVPSHIALYLLQCPDEFDRYVVQLESVTCMMKLLAVSSDPSGSCLANPSSNHSPSSASPRHWKSSSVLLPDRLDSYQAPLLVEKIRLMRHCVAVATGYSLRTDTAMNIFSKDTAELLLSPQSMAACDFGRVVLTPLLLHWLGSASDSEFAVIRAESIEEEFGPEDVLNILRRGSGGGFSSGRFVKGSSQSYIAQTVGFLCMINNDGTMSHGNTGQQSTFIAENNTDSFHYLSQLWRILMHKLDSDSARAGRGALRCMTCIVEVLAVEYQSHISGRLHSVKDEKVDDYKSSPRGQLAVEFASDLMTLIAPLLTPFADVNVNDIVSSTCFHNRQSDVKTTITESTEETPTDKITVENTKLNSSQNSKREGLSLSSGENHRGSGQGSKVVIHPAEEHMLMLQGVALGSLADLARRGVFSPISNKNEENVSSEFAYELKIFMEKFFVGNSNPVECSDKNYPCVKLIEMIFVLIPSVLPAGCESSEKVSTDSVHCRSKVGSRQQVNTFLCCMLLRAISHMSTAVAHVAQSVFKQSFTLLLHASEFPLREILGHVAVRFALAEGLVFMALNSSPFDDNGIFPTSDMMTLLKHVENRVLISSETTAVTVVSEQERGFCGILLLVWLKQLRDVCSARNEVLTEDVLTRCCVSFLLLVRGRHMPKFSNSRNETNSVDARSGGETAEPFLQDVCCAGLCIAYDIACGDSQASSRNSARDKISSLVIATLCREKKSVQPAGIATAGETTERAQETMSGTAVQEALGRLQRTVPVPQGGDGNDILAAAAARAQEALNIYHATGQGGENGSRGRIEQGQEENYSYGVYTKICKVAKKAGDPGVVFAVLSLVVRDPAYAQEPYSRRYRCPMVSLHKDRIPALIPMLYQAKFDPNETIADVMTQLWNLLIPPQQQNALLNLHTKDILQHLASVLSSKQWRDRETACLALESFLPTKTWNNVRPTLQQLWSGGMRVLDDIRDSTRLAAVSFMKVLSNHIVGACNPELQKNLALRRGTYTPGSNGDSCRQPNSSSTSNEEVSVVEDATAFIIPILLDKGLLEPSPESRGFSLGLLLRVVKTTRASLSEHIPKLVHTLVEAMSAMEPQTLQYLQFHTERLNIDQKELEDTRLKLSSQSPLQEALDICLDSLCATSHICDSNKNRSELNKCLGRVCTVMVDLAVQTQQGIGMPTRVTAVRSLLHIVNTFVNDVYIQYVISRQLPGDSFGMDLPHTLQQCFRLIKKSLLPPSTGILSSPLLKRELLLALGTLSKYINGDFLILELIAMLDIYQPNFIDHPEVKAPLPTRYVIAQEELDANDNRNSSGSGSNIPIVASASFNQRASSSSHEFTSGIGGTVQDSDTVIAIAEIFQNILQKAGDSTLQEHVFIGDDDQDDVMVKDFEYDISQFSVDHGAERERSFIRYSSKQFWNRLLACAYVGSFEKEEEASHPWVSVFAEAVILSGAGNKVSAIKTVLHIVLRRIVKLLSGLSWLGRTQGLRVLRDILSLFPGDLLAPNLGSVVLAMLRLLPGSMWTGKEEVFKALSQIIEKCPQCIMHFGENSSEQYDYGLYFVSVPTDSDSALTKLVLTFHDTALGSPQSAIHTSSIRLRKIYSEVRAQSVCATNSDSSASASQTFISGLDDADVFFVPSYCKGWCLSWKGLLKLFLGEAKGLTIANREYRVHVSTALASLPWAQFYAEEQGGIFLWLQVLVPFLRFAGMSPVTLLEVVEVLLQGFVMNASDCVIQTLEQERVELLSEVQNSFISNSEKIDKSAPSMSNVDLQVKAENRSKFNMFGGRYGDNKESSVLKRTAQKDSRQSSPEFIEAKDPKPESQNLMHRSTLDPAFRQNFLFALSHCCPPALSLNGVGFLPALLPLLTTWILSLMRSEVWSVRRAALNLLAPLLKWAPSILYSDHHCLESIENTSDFESNRMDVTCSVLANCVKSLELGTTESKYAQVRIAAAEGLEVLLQNLCVSQQSNSKPFLHFLPQADVHQLESTIRSIIRILSADNSPTVLSRYSKINTIWSAYQPSKNYINENAEAQRHL